MVKYRVNITDEALADMENLYSNIATTLQAPESAMKQYNRIAKAILSLETLPEKFALFENEPEHSLNVRRMIVDSYLVCYMVISNRLEQAEAPNIPLNRLSLDCQKIESRVYSFLHRTICYNCRR